jgi:regulator of sigma E protease
MNLFIAILGLAFLILIHEAGHFFVSLAVGMRPRSFNVGFGPPLAKVRRRGIDYAVRAIPLGGYVKIPGMHRPAPKDVDIVFARALHAAPELVGPAERLKRALAQDDLEEARRRLAEFSDAAADVGVTGVEKGIQELEDALSPQAYWRAPTMKRIAAILAGPATNFVFAVLAFAIVFAVAAGQATTTVEAVLANRPAAVAGLQPGDQVFSIQVDHKEPVVINNTPSRITDVISTSNGAPLVVTVVRNGQAVNLRPVRPVKSDTGVYRLGFQLKAEPYPAGQAIWESLKTTGYVTKDTVVSLGSIFNKKDREQLSGPVGISKGLKDAVHYGWGSYLLLLGFISLSLALLNMLPLLPLDGGHIAFSILEGIRGRAIAREIYERVSAVGIALVLLLFVVGLSNDVGRLGG